jgi:hypothetical protein
MSSKPVSLRVAYGWQYDEERKDSAHPLSDARWQGIRQFLQRIVKQVENRHAKLLESGLVAQNRLSIRGPDRLLAMPGEFLQRSIFNRIAETDILIADISYRNRNEHYERTPNVLLEVGAALANGRTQVFLIEDWIENKSAHDGLSDLSGFYVTRIRADADTDAEKLAKLLSEKPALRMSIQGAITALLRDRGMWPEGGGIETEED